MSREDVSKLPKWARQRIEILERDCDYLRGQLHEFRAGSGPYFVPRIFESSLKSDPIYAPMGVVCHLHHWTVSMRAVDDGGPRRVSITWHASRPSAAEHRDAQIVVEPVASNQLNLMAALPR